MQSRSGKSLASKATTLAFLVMVGAIVGVLIATVLLVLSSRSARADHDSLQTICPDPIQEGNTASMGLKRPGHRVVHAYFFTHHGWYTASPNDFTEYHGVKFETDSDERTLWVPIVTTEDAVPEHDETFAIGFSDDGVWHQCMVTIVDDDGPEITGVAISSLPVDGYAYRAGESIDVTVSTTAPVDADGTPLLSLYLSDGDGNSWRGAEYLTGSGTYNLVFRYRVQPHDFDADGVTVGSAAVADDRTAAHGFAGNIFYAGTDVPIDYTHAGVPRHWRQRVDGRPYAQSVQITSSPSNGWEAYRANEVIEVAFTFDTRVVVEGDVSVTLYLGYDGYHSEGTARHADYLRGSGTDTLVFGYTVRSGDMDPRGIMVALGTDQVGFGGTGTIKARGTNVERNPWYRGLGPQPEHRVDTEAPSISRLAITSEPANGTAYAAGETVTVRVAFEEEVTLKGNPYVELDVGGVTKQASLRPLPGAYSDVLEFDYVVQEGDADSDGIGVGANRLSPNGRGIYDSAGNAADLSHEMLPADLDHRVAAQ